MIMRSKENKLKKILSMMEMVKLISVQMMEQCLSCKIKIKLGKNKKNMSKRMKLRKGKRSNKS